MNTNEFFYAHDCGQALNPEAVEGQLQGSIITLKYDYPPDPEGPFEHLEEVYVKKTWPVKSITPFSRRIKISGSKGWGFYAYQLSHTDDGFSQGFMHFT